jgi:hypothetical protein
MVQFDKLTLWWWVQHIRSNVATIYQTTLCHNTTTEVQVSVVDPQISHEPTWVTKQLSFPHDWPTLTVVTANTRLTNGVVLICLREVLTLRWWGKAHSHCHSGSYFLLFIVYGDPRIKFTYCFDQANTATTNSTNSQAEDTTELQANQFLNGILWLIFINIYRSDSCVTPAKVKAVLLSGQQYSVLRHTLCYQPQLWSTYWDSRNSISLHRDAVIKKLWQREIHWLNCT